MQESFPLVTIVIPVYNQERSFLEECIESALAQTYQSCEVLISNNHSDEVTSTVLEQYSKDDSRVRLIRPNCHLPMVDHFDFAIRSAVGEYICILCSDDVLHPNHVEALMFSIQFRDDLHASFSLPAQGKERSTKRAASPIKSGIYTSTEFFASATRAYVCSLGSMIFSKSKYFDIGGFRANLKYAFDVYFIFQLIFSCDEVSYLEEPTAFIREWERDEQRARQIDHLSDLVVIYEMLNQRVAGTQLSSILARNKRRVLYPQIITGMLSYLRLPSSRVDLDLIFTRFLRCEPSTEMILALRLRNRKYFSAIVFLLRVYNKVHGLINKWGYVVKSIEKYIKNKIILHFS